MSAPSPVQASARTYYGVQVVDVGEEGDMLVLGHDHPTRRVIAALNAHSRYLGARFADVVDTAEDAARFLEQRWAQLHCEGCGTPLADPEKPLECPDNCNEGETNWHEYEWCADWYAKPDAPGAFPVVVWRA